MLSFINNAPKDFLTEYVAWQADHLASTAQKIHRESKELMRQVIEDTLLIKKSASKKKKRKNDDKSETVYNRASAFERLSQLQIMCSSALNPSCQLLLNSRVRSALRGSESGILLKEWKALKQAQNSLSKLLEELTSEGAEALINSAYPQAENSVPSLTVSPSIMKAWKHHHLVNLGIESWSKLPEVGITNDNDLALIGITPQTVALHQQLQEGITVAFTGSFLDQNTHTDLSHEWSAVFNGDLMLTEQEIAKPTGRILSFFEKHVPKGYLDVVEEELRAAGMDPKQKNRDEDVVAHIEKGIAARMAQHGISEKEMDSTIAWLLSEGIVKFPSKATSAIFQLPLAATTHRLIAITEIEKELNGTNLLKEINSNLLPIANQLLEAHNVESATPEIDRWAARISKGICEEYCPASWEAPVAGLLRSIAIAREYSPERFLQRYLFQGATLPVNKKRKTVQLAGPHLEQTATRFHLTTQPEKKLVAAMKEEWEQRRKDGITSLSEAASI
jgi:hypothetical protein